MATTKSPAQSRPGNKTGKRSSNNSENEQGGMHSSQLMKLMEHQLKDIYWVEKALTKAIPKMIKNATSEELVEALENHLSETTTQVNRIEEGFEVLGKKPAAKKCIAMEGLIKEAQEIMEESDAGPMRDAGIICSAQKIEHYEIATYGTLRQFAETLGLDEAKELFQGILDEEKAADEALTEVAVSSVNIEAGLEEEHS